MIRKIEVGLGLCFIATGAVFTLASAYATVADANLFMVLAIIAHMTAVFAFVSR